jgi:hypothetical protein
MMFSLSPFFSQLFTLDYRSGDRVDVRLIVPKKMPLDVALARGLAWKDGSGRISPIAITGHFNLGDNTFYRTFYYPSDPKKCPDPSLAGTLKKTEAFKISQLDNWNRRGYGVYFIVNPGGRSDADITKAKNLYYECDGIDKQAQWEKLRRLEALLGRPATRVVETRNSLHCYFALSEALTPEEFSRYQQRLIQCQDSDGGIFNPARLMRLEGFDHQKWDEETGTLLQFPVTCKQQTNSVFDIAEFDAILPEWDEDRWGKKAATKRTSTSNGQSIGSFEREENSPWDIRNFAQYLEGGTERHGGRRYRCPQHNGESLDSLVIFPDGHFYCQAGCNGKAVYAAALATAQAGGYQLPRTKQDADLDRLRARLEAMAAETEPRVNTTPAPEPEPEATSQAPEPTPEPAWEYAQGARLATWQSAIADDYRYVLDLSETGAGKSHDSGMATPSMFGAMQIFYASGDHRNPTAWTLEESNNWVDMEARHNGLVYAGDSNKLIRRTDEDDPYDVEPNCSRNKFIEVLREKRINGADTVGTVCGGCPLKEKCQHSEGNGYGYLNQRRAALTSPKTRIHPASLPGDDYEYDETAIIWDEPGQSFQIKSDISVGLMDLEKTIAALIQAPEILPALLPLFEAMLPIVKGEEKLGKFGLDHLKLVEKWRPLLPEDLDVEAVEAALKPDFSFTNTVQDYDADLSDLPSGVRKLFAKSDDELASLAERQLIKQWFPAFLRALKGEVGTLRAVGKSLTLTLPDDRHRNVVKEAAAVIFLDATHSRADLALKLECDPDEIFVCVQASEDHGNLTITQITDLGRMGIQRGEDQKLRRDELIAHYKAEDPTTGVIDFKRHGGDSAGAWWRDSRGSNAFYEAGVKRLILVGTPCRNIADLQAEWATLTGNFPQEGDSEFQAFVDRTIRSEFRQAIGRLRANRRPGESLEIVIISDFDLKLPVQKKAAWEVTPKAAAKTDQLAMKAITAIKTLKEKGEKITQTAIAALCDVSQATISGIWEIISFAIYPSNSKTDNSADVTSATCTTSLQAEKIPDPPPSIEPPPAPVVHFTPGHQVRWPGHIGEWVISAITDGIARVKQVGGVGFGRARLDELEALTA